MDEPGKVALAMIARFLLYESPRVLDWINGMKAEGKTEVTDEDLQQLKNKWDVPGAKFFE